MISGTSSAPSNVTMNTSISYCPGIRSTVSRRLSLIEVQQPAEPFAAADVAIDGRRSCGRERDDVAEALMMALGMVVGDKLGDDRSQVTLAQGMMCGRHSCRIDRTNRSANALRLGLLAGSCTTWTPAEASKLSNCAVYRGSRSTIMWLKPRRGPATASVRWRATCAIRWPSARQVTSAM